MNKILKFYNLIYIKDFRKKRKTHLKSMKLYYHV
jgi:hypothetical protein